MANNPNDSKPLPDGENLKESSSSAFVEPGSFSKQWSDITLLQTRSRNLIYTAVRYGRRFLLKALRPEHAGLTEYQQLQEKEFRLGISLNHPNIAATYSYEDVPGIGICIVQEYVDGVTLGEWLATEQTNAARKRVFMQLLDALEYLHDRQLVHHDLHRENILITRNGNNLKLIDFGLSDTDDSVALHDNDMRADIRRLAPLMKLLFPRRYAIIRRRCASGRYPNIAALRRAMQMRQKWFVTLLMLFFLLSGVSGVMLYLSLNDANTRRELTEMKHAIDNGVDVEEIKAVLDSVYRPVYDSLELPDARYQEIARAYVVNLPKPMIEYNRMIKRYKTGSMQYAAFSEAWMAVLSQIVVSDLTPRIDSLPNFSTEVAEGRLSEAEALRLRELYQGIYKRHH